MSETIIPVTRYATHFSGVLPSGSVDRGIIRQEKIEQTVYPNGATVTRVYESVTEVYDSRGVMSLPNRPNQVDVMI
jgi:hypothetical protein